MSNYDLIGFISVSKETFIEQVIGYISGREIINKDTHQKLYLTHTCKLVNVRCRKK